MKLDQLAEPKPMLDEDTLATITKGSQIKIQLTDGISDKFNETIIMEVVNRDSHVIEARFIRRQTGRFDDAQSASVSPFSTDTVVFIKEAVFAVLND
ncbi:hypothetical protein J4G53_24055 [Serratia ureilytica]|uniref:hypothetical protein n=1 Tax=Serratia ureilytica TaxID=300181 RepID=UPI001AA1AF52|nr:hypothetical protein [Serratia ureilytica]MBO1811315.1 hypothetical protein [Serratia ureilytica]